MEEREKRREEKRERERERELWQNDETVPVRLLLASGKKLIQ